MNFKNVAVILTVIIVFSANLSAQKKTAVLKLCAFINSEPFSLFTENKEDGEKLGFKKYKDSNTFIRSFRVLVDNIPTSYFKPIEKSTNCITVYRLEPGKKNISLEFRSSSYTNLETKTPYAGNFKPDILYTGNIDIVEGKTASVIINQLSNNISLFQALDNTPVENCTSKCSVPVGIPIYFMMKSQDEKVKCPVKFDLIVDSEKDKALSCYDPEKIEKLLANHVEKNNIMCRINVEFAYFKVFGEGCIVSIESDKEGLNFQTPEIKLLPLDKQKFKYFWKINSDERKPYTFSGDRKGTEKTPAADDVIEITEERNF